jgi:hypothetical protein
MRREVTDAKNCYYENRKKGTERERTSTMREKGKGKGKKTTTTTMRWEEGRKKGGDGGEGLLTHCVVEDVGGLGL